MLLWLENLTTNFLLGNTKQHKQYEKLNKFNDQVGSSSQSSSSKYLVINTFFLTILFCDSIKYIFLFIYDHLSLQM